MRKNKDLDVANCPSGSAGSELAERPPLATYEEYIAEIMRLQREYIKEERRRYKKAETLWLRYVADMRALGIHPLKGMEITDRLKQLNRMEQDAEQTHGDTECNRYRWQDHLTALASLDAR